MSLRNAMLAALCLAPLMLASGSAAAQDTAPVKLKNGVLCQEQQEDAFEGETHRCYFLPQQVGKRNFATRNGRAQYIVSALAPDCDEIEILGDGTSTRVGPDGSELKQVSVHCTE